MDTFGIRKRNMRMPSDSLHSLGLPVFSVLLVLFLVREAGSRMGIEIDKEKERSKN